MSNLVDRYVNLCQAYVQLADKFHKLDVDYMTLRSNVIPALKTLKLAKPHTERLIQENLFLRKQLSDLTAKYEELKSLEAFLAPETQEYLIEAEEQVSLVEATLQEREGDLDPDLSDADKSLLDEYQVSPDKFNMIPDVPEIHLEDSYSDSANDFMNRSVA